MGHWYNPDRSGERSHTSTPGWLPSVSTILKATQPFLMQQSLTQAALRNPYKFAQRKDQAGDRGDSIHNWIHCYLTHAMLPELNFCYQPYVERVKQFLDGLTVASDFYASEFQVYHPQFAGTVDLYSFDSVANLKRLYDFKTRDRPMQSDSLHEAKLQLTGYAEAFEHSHGQQVDQCLVVIVSPDGLFIHTFSPIQFMDEWQFRVGAYYGYVA